MASKSPISTRPIDADDAAIEAALNDAHLPSLMAATVHLSGDISPLTGDIKPFYDFFGDGQGGLNDEQRARVRKQALNAIIAYRDRGHTLPPQPAQNDVRTMMNFVAGAEIPDHYIPFLRNELALEDDDPDAPEWGHTISDSTKQRFRVLIIGAGMSGILAAIRLGQAGVPYIIIDKNADVGGTWTENTYPGCRVDNPNHMYSYSFEPNHDWPQHYSTQPNLNAYFKNVAIKYGVRDQVQFNSVAETCVYDEARAIWSVTVKRGNGKTETIEANAVITAVGQLNRPNYPDIKGRDTFKGPAFHSSRWNHDVDLTGNMWRSSAPAPARFSSCRKLHKGETHGCVSTQRTAGPNAGLSRRCWRRAKMAFEACRFMRNGTLLDLLDLDRWHSGHGHCRARLEWPQRCRIADERHAA